MNVHPTSANHAGPAAEQSVEVWSIVSTQTKLSARQQRRWPGLAMAVLALVLFGALACTQPEATPTETIELTPPAVNTVSGDVEAPTVAAQQAAESEAVPAVEQPAQSGTPETEMQLTASAIAAAHDEVMSGIYERTVPSVVGPEGDQVDHDRRKRARDAARRFPVAGCRIGVRLGRRGSHRDQQARD